MQTIIISNIRATSNICVNTHNLNAALDRGQLKREERLTALDSRAVARHSAQPICWKVSSEGRWMLSLASIAGPCTAEIKRLLLSWLPIVMSVSYHSEEGWKRKEKSPPRKHLLPQLPRQNSQEKDMSPEVSECATKNPSQERSGAAGAVQERVQAAALNMTKRHPPCKYCLQRASQLRSNMLLLYIFLLFMCSEEVSFLLLFLWLAGILVLDVERHIIDTLGEELHYRVNFALECSWDKGFQCLYLQESWTAYIA